MRAQSLAAAGVLLIGAVGLFAWAKPAQPPNAQPKDAPAAKPLERVLPGLRQDGFVQLPNQWRLKPAGRQLEQIPLDRDSELPDQDHAVIHHRNNCHAARMANVLPDCRLSSIQGDFTSPQRKNLSLMDFLFFDPRLHVASQGFAPSMDQCQPPVRWRFRISSCKAESISRYDSL